MNSMCSLGLAQAAVPRDIPLSSLPLNYLKGKGFYISQKSFFLWKIGNTEQKQEEFSDLFSFAPFCLKSNYLISPQPQSTSRFFMC